MVRKTPTNEQREQMFEAIRENARTRRLREAIGIDQAFLDKLTELRSLPDLPQTDACKDLVTRNPDTCIDEMVHSLTRLIAVRKNFLDPDWNANA
jgi:nucleotidyltransferase/DNA polymerase involved in DNA repair